MKRSISFLIFLIIFFTLIISLILNVTQFESKKNEKSEKIEIIATLFPQYDFAKKVGGDKVNVTLLLPPGTESHTYEPTPQDIAKINNSNIFIYTGEEMEPWAEKLILGMKNNIHILDLSTTISLINNKSFEEKNFEYEDLKQEHKDEQHEHAYDPHIWLNPLYAIKMVESIEKQLCEIDSENTEYYKHNAEQYIKEIKELDMEFEQVVNESSNKKIAFGGAFAYAYFIERYNIEFISAYKTCGENVEPSTTKVKEVIDYINENKIPVIFYKEYSSGNIAKTISEATGAKMLVFNTVHNISNDEIASGASYVSIMKMNLKNLKEAMN